MTEEGGSLARGRRKREEVPEPPSTNQLNDLAAEAQSVIKLLVDASGGRFDSPTTKQIEVGSVALLSRYVDQWVRQFAEVTSGRVRFAGRPGIWHALDELYPLQDPNRWDRLRGEILFELECLGWVRERPPRGTTWMLPDGPATDGNAR
jgi:hypothetical protein